MTEPSQFPRADLRLTDAQSRVLECAARGDEADCLNLAESEKRIDADWIRGVLLGYVAIDGARADVDRGVRLSETVPDSPHSAAFGPRALRIRGAHIIGTLNLAWCGSSSQPLPTLSFTHCRFEPAADGTSKPADSDPSIDLSNAHLSGLELTGSRLVYLRGVGMRVDGSVDIREIGPLVGEGLCWGNLSRACVGADVLADDVRLKAPVRADWEDKYDFFELRWALNLVMSRVGGSVMIRKSPRIDGGVILDSAHICGDLQIENAEIQRRRGEVYALALERARIDGSFRVISLPDGGLHCKGRIWMHRAAIGGSFDLKNAIVDGFWNVDPAASFGLALYARAATARGGVTLSHVEARGLICLHGIQTDGALVIENLTGEPAPAAAWPDWFPTPDGDPQPFAVDTRCARIGTDLRLARITVRGAVDLSDAQCTTLAEDLTSQPTATHRLIDGLTYTHVESSWFKDGRFEQWLGCDEASYRPQPYVQLAEVFARHGQDSHARNVLLAKAKRDARREWYDSAGGGASAAKSSDRNPGFVRRFERMRITALRRCVYLAFLVPYGFFFDFGLSPLKAVATLALSIAIGTAMFGWMNSHGAMVVTQMPIANYFQGQFIVAQAPASGPVSVACGRSIRLPVYAADVFIPLVDLREEPKCDIDAVNPFPGGARSDAEITVYRWLKAIYALSGWLVTTLAVLTFSGVMRHRLSEE